MRIPAITAVQAAPSPPQQSPMTAAEAFFNNNCDQGMSYLKEATDRGSAEAKVIVERSLRQTELENPDTLFRNAKRAFDEFQFRSAYSLFLQVTQSSADELLRGEAHYRIHRIAALGHLREFTRDDELKYLKAAADLGYGQAMLDYATKAYNYYNTEHDIPTARKYFAMAIEKGTSDIALRSRFWLAEMEYEMKDAGGDLVKARENFKIVADHGEKWNSLRAAFICAEMAYKGIGGPKDLNEAGHYFLIAGGENTDSPNPIALFRYAEIHDELGQDKTAREYYRKASSESYEAALRYADMAYSGRGGEVDLKEARLSYCRAAETPRGAYRYAQMLQKGEGGKKDRKGAEWYFATAKQLGYKEDAPVSSETKGLKGLLGSLRKKDQ